MRVALIGQQAFGKAALEAFMARGDTVAAVFCAPEKGRPDPLRLAAEAAGVPVHSFPRLTSPEALQALRDAEVELGVMAFVTQFVSQAFCAIPTHGTIQFHPSLLPLHRGASSLGWSIILGRSETGFSIFRPVDGLDEGPLILQRRVPIAPGASLGSVYFDGVFPAGVTGLLDAADMVIGGTAVETPQDEAAATYEGIIGTAESRIDWSTHADITYNLIRGCDPSPGAWTTEAGHKLFLFDCRKEPVRTFAQAKGKRLGEVVATDAETVTIKAPGGLIIAHRLRREGGPKVKAGEAGLPVGTILGTILGTNLDT